MAMRAQISLQFDDAELFDNFVTPYKEGRILNSLIIKCLSAYYYNEEVRNLIEGTSIEDATDGETIQTNQTLCDSIRQSLMMQDFLASELQNTINNGTEDVENILNKTNDLAKKSGIVKPNTSEFGGDVLRIEVADNKSVNNGQVTSTSSTDTVSNPTMELIIGALIKLAEGVGNSEVVGMLHTKSEPSAQTETTVEVKTPSLASEIEVLKSEESAPTKFVETVVVDEDFVTEEVVPTGNDFKSNGVVESVTEATSTTTEDVTNINNDNNDASESMQELLSSLF